MKRILITLNLCLFCAQFVLGQYHALIMPASSPKISETQRLGVTDIEVNYHSPAVRGREIWGQLVPMDGNPVPWRAGANINTTIAFSTDVRIEGQHLAAGSYGLHTIPSEKSWTIIFANNDNLWGSYYLDKDKDVALQVQVVPQTSAHREYMSFEFLNRTDSTLVVALEWEKLRVPISIEVDLNTTVVESFRYQLRGHTTNAWAAWNAAAQWCLSRNTNLEEALQWANRSIEGGFGGFRANKNFTNLSTKASILWQLNKKEESDRTLDEAFNLVVDPGNAYPLGRSLIDQGRSEKALTFYQKLADKFSDKWFVHLGLARAYNALDDNKKALKAMVKAQSMAPDNYKEYLGGLSQKIQEGEKI